MIVGFTPAFVALVIFVATVLDVRLHQLLDHVVALLRSWQFLLLLFAVVLPLLIVGVLHLLENRESAAWMPRRLS